jgi:twitching motility two-component system response regulator PilH
MNTSESTATKPFPSAAALHANDARGTILLVEDDRSIRRYLEVILTRAGFTVITAADGLEAMKVALASSIDAVVTDAVMPNLNGYELCRFLRRHPKLSCLPVILLSGLQSADSAHDTESGADVYLSKPVRPEELTLSLGGLLLKAA